MEDLYRKVRQVYHSMESNIEGDGQGQSGENFGNGIRIGINAQVSQLEAGSHVPAVSYPPVLTYLGNQTQPGIRGDFLCFPRPTSLFALVWCDVETSTMHLPISFPLPIFTSPSFPQKAVDICR